MFSIEKVIRRIGDKSLVKWLGYPDEFNSWVDNKDLVKLYFFKICLKMISVEGLVMPNKPNKFGDIRQFLIP